MPNNDTRWFNTAIVYAFDISSFYDENGDGVGDFKGAKKKLSYLADLGITCVWLLPFFPSPNLDNGYDVSDYYNIDPNYGNLDDFTAFMREAEKNHIRVIIDLVLHHTSNQHPWFKAGRLVKNSRYRDYYFWQKNPPFTTKENVFQANRNNVWSYDEEAQKYYHHKYYPFEPDLNMWNPKVQAEILSITDFWLDMGVSGFRLDAATHLFDQKGSDKEKKQQLQKFLKKLNKSVRQKNPEAILLAEADVEPEQIENYIGNGDQIHLIFNFLTNNAIFYSLAERNSIYLRKTFKKLPKLANGMEWGNFIRNLDELNLDRLTEEQREVVFSEFGPNPKMQIFQRGIRRRIGPMVHGDWNILKMLFSLIISMPGVPFITYGDEIGLGDDLSLKGRSAVRTAMQWNKTENAGFSIAPEEKLAHGLIKEGIFSYKFINVEDQEMDSISLLSTVKELLKLRKSFPLVDECKLLEVDNDAVFALSYKLENQTMIVLHNFSKQAEILKIKNLKGRQSRQLIGDATYSSIDNDEVFNLNPNGFCWFLVE